MYKQVMMTTLFSVFFGLISHAQRAAIIGKWETPDKDIIEFYSEGPVFTARQISAEIEKDKGNNNKIIAKELKSTTAKVFEGIVIDPKDNKTYHGRFTINDSGTQLNLKVKWGFLSFNETWKRVN
ncbi:hypothetical protein SAMN05428975_0970 [Mucilaginibacter sp. OK268]|uniref:DUF2147 domain-containing protein n=1 Tax=Mucilaginibacter sp. OK268 TaxID=1881048 RepID=UPI0008803EDE|nr:DUF2147 domain-containing protein [Mucilaginibacter sp. OK268]SDP27895.1 hypothetical protein SAMN05428975_0970 [Mucilaginibacter sp. OK268]